MEVYEYCGGLKNDIHRLDRDKDGSACESLP
ncbi:MAG: excalibur calcium-binding domain-containing protein [Candidatus Andersenbacteria bacterium]|nr:excalibur calcium-binding domain-containing protein [Candidatus Andersenbacteria bacterium]